MSMVAHLGETCKTHDPSDSPSFVIVLGCVAVVMLTHFNSQAGASVPCTGQ
jgi:hypothetical protein